MRLAGRTAVVTGAAGGMGRAAAALFAHEGARVVVADLNEEGGRETVALITKEGGEASFYAVDVSDSVKVKGLMDFAVQSYGRLDVLFNNAGIALFGRDGKVAEVTEEDWERVLAVNLKGVYLGMRYAIPHMVQQGGGSIVNNASIAGLVGFPSLAAYCASKGGVIQLTRAAALDYGPQKIRVNAICPGVIRTPMTDELLTEPTSKEQMLQQTVIGRLGEPEDIANAALFLASDQAAFITGAVLTVDGGWTVH